MKSDNLEKEELDMKSRVMGEIKKKQICITCPSMVFAKKMGLESALVFSIIWGALMISIFLYFLEKTKLFKFIGLGFPGLKIFLTTIPYDYIALFILSMIAAIYFANKLDLSYERKIPDNLFVLVFVLASILVGMFFVAMGFHEIVKGWSKNDIPHDSAIVGRIIDFSPKEIIVQEEDGNIVKIEMKKGVDFYNKDIDFKGKIMRAVGDRDEKNEGYFNAEDVLCCDND